MRIPVSRKATKIYPNSKRVFARFFSNGAERARSVIQKVMQMSDEETATYFSQILREFSRRHRNITRVFEKHAGLLKPYFIEAGIDYNNVNIHRRWLIGSYFTMEYAIESAAFFNPSMVEDIDQTNLEDGAKRVIISFRAVGEGHISSIVFRRAVIDRDNEIHLDGAGKYIDEPEIYRDSTYEKYTFFQKAASIKLPKNIKNEIAKDLKDEFEYEELKTVIRNLQKTYNEKAEIKQHLERMLWLSNSFYEINFSLDTDISDRVIFPYSSSEKRGMEDARFVRFTDDNGDIIYYATYTAYDGVAIQPMLLETRDFYHFHIMPLYGEGAQNKNLALFPRKINGKYAMVSRIDGINNYVVFSDDLNVWENPVMLHEPKHPWSFIQVGNCGSPIETEAGWLLMIHGVGPMRQYCISACLLELGNPQKEIDQLKDPLLTPLEEEREGYVPNVVYSCGSIIHNGEVIIPYGMSDYASSFASVPLNKLIEAILQGG
ncbi:MAG: glycosidase [Chitinophagaceae bacterium]|nr:MAG: glycosidase [Chitinophagaceae bacterium]